VIRHGSLIPGRGLSINEQSTNSVTEQTKFCVS
jgi:hypothetical protein